MTDIWFRWSNPFRAFFISFVVILLLPNIAGYFSYRISIQEARVSSRAIGMSVLEQSRQNVDQRLKEVISFTQQIGSDAALEQLLDPVDVQKRILQLNQLSRTLTLYASTNDFLGNTYIYLRNSNTIVTPGSVFVRPEHYYSLNRAAGSTYEDWMSGLVQGNESGFIPSESYRVTGSERKFVKYTRALPIGNMNAAKGTVVVLIDEEKILNMLKSISAKFEGWTYIANSMGEIIASSGIAHNEAVKINRSLVNEAEPSTYGDTILFSSNSPQLNNWSYVAGLPKSAIMQSASRIQSTTWLLTAITLIFGLLVSLFLAYRYSRPVLLIAESIRDFLNLDNGPLRNGYDFIQGNVSQILIHNRQLRSEIVRQEPILKNAFVNSLLHSEFKSAIDLQAAAEQAKILQLNEHGNVVIVQVRGYGEMKSKEILHELFAARLIVKQAILEAIPNLLLTEQDFDKLVLIVPEKRADEDHEHDIQDLIDGLQKLNSNPYKLLFTAAISSSFHSFLEISRAFEESGQVLEYANLLDSEGFFWHEDLPKNTTMYYYPLELELRLIHAIRAGDCQTANSILDEVFHENFEARELAVEINYLFISELKSSLLKGFDNRSNHASETSDTLNLLKNEILQLQVHHGTEFVKCSIQQSVQSFCEWIELQKNEVENKMALAITEYLEQNYRNPGLTMAMIADAIGRPEKYLAQLYKTHTGEYITVRLEKMRMNRAQQLLSETDATIDILSEQCGYASRQSFNRAFKRYFGVTPNEYRQTSRS